MTTYAVVDLSNLFHKSRHVTSGEPELKVGMAMHIIFRSLRKIHRDFNIDHMVFCVDSGSWRYDIYPAYKSKRKLARLEATPSEQKESELFFFAMNELTDYLDKKTKTTVLRSYGVEADDFVSRWIYNHPNDQHIIVSGDSDFIQLLSSNVKIYDGISDRLISQDSVIDWAKKEKHEFHPDSGSGKLKVGEVNENFVPETDWWKKALFIKLIRGDVGDGIFSANPGVRYKGSSKRIGIEEAWEDRHEKGFHWNNFFLQTWSKLDGVDADGQNITKLVKVLDEYKINEKLIDLTKQPEDIKLNMDKTISEATSKIVVDNTVGFNFIKFCKKFDLPNVMNEANAYVEYLSAPYKKMLHG